MKNKVILSILTVGFILQGCSVNMAQYQFNTAVEGCKNHGGVSNIKLATIFGLIDADALYIAYCSDGTMIPAGGIKK